MGEIIRRGEAAEEDKKKITRRRRVRGGAQRKEKREKQIPFDKAGTFARHARDGNSRVGNTGVGVTARGDVGDNLLRSDYRAAWGDECGTAKF
jgi:hypothetical protein